MSRNYKNDPEDPKRNSETYEQGQSKFKFYENCFCISGEGNEGPDGNTLVHGKEKDIVYIMVKDMHQSPTMARLITAAASVYKTMQESLKRDQQ